VTQQLSKLISSRTLSENPEPAKLARAARLRYVLDDSPGYSREKNGKGFVYRSVRGNRLRSPQQLARIESLAIPPAWQEVWICPYANGHLQATGRDDRQRKQYIYHERWQEASQQAKFGRLARFGRVLAKLRRQVLRDLRDKGLTRKRLLAGMVALLDETSIRVGNEEYFRENGSFGLATLRSRHVTIRRGTAVLSFRGKSGLKREASVLDRRLVKLLRELKRVPGARLFQWIDGNGVAHPATAADVNEYLREHTGQAFTAKDFRTWKASAHVAGLFSRQVGALTVRKRKLAMREAIVSAADLLGNTTTICRRYYIHPQILVCFEVGAFEGILNGSRRTRGTGSRDEQILACFLRRCDKSNRA
jgi:DNA topoisomerase-1